MTITVAVRVGGPESKRNLVFKVPTDMPGECAEIAVMRAIRKVEIALDLKRGMLVLEANP